VEVGRAVERDPLVGDVLAHARQPELAAEAALLPAAAFLEQIEAGTVFVNRAAGATSGGWPGQQSYAGWKGSGSTNRGGLGPRYVAQFLREQGRNIVKD
jgi:acyl-CoA reductase-like NAD-dependent aldehyde dehydrogenase